MLRRSLTIVTAALFWALVAAKTTYAQSAAFTAQHKPIEQVVADRNYTVEFLVEPADRISYAIVYTRTGNEVKFKPHVVRAQSGGRFLAELGADRAQMPNLEYFIRVVDIDGASHDIVASAREPVVVFVVPQDMAANEPELQAATLDSGVEGFDLSGLDALAAEFQLLQVEDVVVSAAKRTQSVTEAPAAIYVLTRDDIEAFGYTSMADLLRFVPGVQVYRINESTPLVGVRGFADESNNLVLFLQQGRELNVELFGSAFLENQAITLDDVERIEVVRGPGSALYGANAFSGVVQIIPKRADSYEYDYRMRVDREFILGGVQAQMRAAGVTDAAQYVVSGQYRELDSAADAGQRGLRKVATQGRVSFDLGNKPFDVEMGVSGLQGEIFTILGEQTADMLQGDIALRTQLGPARLLLYWNHFDATLGIADPILAQRLDRLRWTADTLNADAQLDFTFGEINRLTLGSVARWNRYWSPQMADPISNEARIGMYIQNELRAHEHIILTVGARSDFSTLYLPDQSLGERLTISPRGSVIVPISENHGLRAGAGQAFRKPSFFEQNARYSALIATDENVANPGLKNEVITGVDAGYTGRIGPVRIGVDAFYNRFRDFIEFDPGTARFANGGRDSDSYGGELALRYAVREDLSVFGNYSYLLIQELRPDPLSDPDLNDNSVPIQREKILRDPAHMVNLGFRYAPQYGLRLAAAMHWQDRRIARFIDPNEGSVIISQAETVRLDAGLFVTARIGWDFGHWLLGVHGEHLEADRHREFPGVGNVQIPEDLAPAPAGNRYGGERLPPRVFAYVEGRF